MTTNHKPATALSFGIGYGFIVTANNDGSIPLSSKALAKIEPGGDQVISEMARRANAYPRLVEALQEAEKLRPMLLRQYQAVPECVLAYCNVARNVLRELGEMS